MLLDIVKKGSTDRSVTIRIIDDTDGTPETGVVYNTSGIDLWYRREGAGVTSLTEADLAALTTAHTDGGFKHISHGYYRLDLPDAAFGSGANYVDIGGTVTGMVVIGGRVRLVDYDPEAVLSTFNPGSDAVATVTNVTNLHASAATAANQTTILNRIGAFTGSGINTILGFFQALMRSDATDPSDVGGTYAAATDSNQAQTDAGGSADWTATEKENIRYQIGINGTQTAPTSNTPNLATLANQTTILNRIGAFTGSGINTILGFFQALMRSDATDPSDVGGTYAAATDSNQAQTDAGGSADWTTDEKNQLRHMIGIDGTQAAPATNSPALSTPATNWSHGQRTLTVPAAAGSGSGSSTGLKLTARVASTWRIPLTGLGDLSIYSKLIFTVKDAKTAADAQSLVQIDDATGLLYLNKATAATAAQGSITVDDVPAGDVTIELLAAAAVALSENTKLFWDIKGIDVAGVENVGPLREGSFVLQGVVTQAVS